MYCDRQWSKGEAVSRHGRARAQQGTATRRYALRHGMAGHAAQASARGLGVLLGCGLCTWCIQPVFDPFDSVLFLSQFLDIVREPDS